MVMEKKRRKQKNKGMKKPALEGSMLEPRGGFKGSVSPGD
jgi:hypothetical protein